MYNNAIVIYCILLFHSLTQRFDVYSLRRNSTDCCLRFPQSGQLSSYSSVFLLEAFADQIWTATRAVAPATFA